MGGTASRWCSSHTERQLASQAGVPEHIRHLSMYATCSEWLTPFSHIWVLNLAKGVKWQSIMGCNFIMKSFWLGECRFWGAKGCLSSFSTTVDITHAVLRVGIVLSQEQMGTLGNWVQLCTGIEGHNGSSMNHLRKVGLTQIPMIYPQQERPTIRGQVYVARTQVQTVRLHQLNVGALNMFNSLHVQIDKTHNFCNDLAVKKYLLVSL